VGQLTLYSQQGKKIMARTQKINENFSLSFNSREDQTGDTVADIDIRFDNPKDDSVIINRLNTWLKAIGREDIVVSPKKLSKGDL
jgi:hypothetical protein